MKHLINLTPYFAASGDSARQMAATPLKNQAPPSDPPPAPSPKINRFLAHFPLTEVVFKNDIQDPGKPWNNGTISQTLANAVLALGTTGAYIPAARIVKLTLPNNGGVRFDLQMPSSGGSFKRPMLDVSEDDDAKTEFIAWRTMVVGAWMDWRRKSVANGTAGTIKGMGTAVGVNADADMLTSLGLI